MITHKSDHHPLHRSILLTAM